jgi:ABC-type molybdate transport system ATPase subunit
VQHLLHVLTACMSLWRVCPARVSIGMELVTSPAILLLDEP